MKNLYSYFVILAFGIAIGGITQSKGAEPTLAEQVAFWTSLSMAFGLFLIHEIFSNKRLRIVIEDKPKGTIEGDAVR